ncbi:MAG: hypothetical protein NC548_64845, partial [Lachnospiraceae bacterium]|nr:hypothetical protein [Lachnospiraceae bacterium]
ACLGMLGLALTSLFVSPIISNAENLEDLEVQEEPMVFAETRANTQYVVKNEKGQDTKKINSGALTSQIRASGASGINDRNVLLSKDVGNVFVSAGGFVGTWYGEFGGTGDAPFFEIEDIEIDLNYFDNQLAGTQSWEEMREHIANFSVYGFDKTKQDFSDFIFFDYETFFNDYEYDIIYTSYTWEELDLTAPSLDIPANYIVNVDNMQTQAQILSHVTVTDDTDPNPQLKVRSTTYNPSNRKIGTYQLVVYAVDASGNSTPDYTFNIIVADSTKPTISGQNKTQPNNVKLTETELLALFSASDNYTDAASIVKTIVNDNYSSSWTRPGSYSVTCRATDTSGNYNDATANITIVDKTAPTISGQNKTQANNVKLTQAELLALFSASDDVSTGSALVKTIVSDNYTSNYTTPGSYSVTCRATDASGNYSEATNTITVVDKTAPTISGTTGDISYTEKVLDLKTLFNFSDDVTAVDDIVFEIIEDNYTANYNVKGTHKVKAKVTDAAGNSSVAESSRTVIDTIKPIITVPSTITIGNSSKYSMIELRKQIVVVDGYDGEITAFTLNDNDDYESNYQTLGSYKFTITATDASSNTQSATITLIVEDTTLPEIFVDGYFIILEEGQELTDEMIIAYASAVLGVTPYDIATVAGMYDTTEVGEYEISVLMYSGESKAFTILVADEPEEPKEPAKWSAKRFFSANMDNWTKFNEWPAWSICAWLSWVGIGLAAVLVISIVFRIFVRKRR